MTYCTLQDLELLAGAAEVDQREIGQGYGAVDKALADATAEADDYLRGRYALPLSVVDSRLRRACVVIARYYLLGDARTEGARQDYKDALAWLKMVQSGQVLLSAASATVAASADPARGTMRVATRVSEFGSLAGYDATMAGVKS